MGDLMLFHAPTTGVPNAALVLDSLRLNANLAAFGGAIELDPGMCAKIWELQLEGQGLGNIEISYSKDSTTGIDGTWEVLKVFSKLNAALAERHEKFNRPIIAGEAWNTTTGVLPAVVARTWIRFREVTLNAVITVVGLVFSVNIEFDEIERQP